MSTVRNFTKPERKPPDGLGAAAEAFWRTTSAEIELESHHYHLLDIAAEALDRRLQARDILAKEGLTCVDPKGKPLPHPCISIERDSAIRFMRALREINIDTAPEEPRAPGLRQISVRRK